GRARTEHMSTTVTSPGISGRSEEHMSELQSLTNLVCRLLLEKKKKQNRTTEQWLKDGKHAGNWQRLSCHDFMDNQVWLKLCGLSYNLGNFRCHSVFF